MNAAALPQKDAMLIVADSKKSVEQLAGMTIQELGRQAAIMSGYTGLSIELCSRIVVHRANRRLGR